MRHFLIAAALLAAPAVHAQERILVLGGSVAEIVFDLGAIDRVIARDTTSTFPDSITALPDVGYLRALSPEGVIAVGPDLILAEPDAGPPEAVDVLTAAGIPDWIAADEADYIAQAIRRAQDPAALAALRARLGLGALGDAATFARGLEAALRAMWRDWCERQA